MTFDPKTEGPHLQHALDYFQYQLKGVSFLPRLEKGAYPQMPIEAIDEETYKKMLSKIKHHNLTSLNSLEPPPEKFCDNDICQTSFQ